METQASPEKQKELFLANTQKKDNFTN